MADIVTDNDELMKQAELAIRNFVQQVTLTISTDETKGPCSGVLFRRHDGYPFVLTAAHVLRSSTGEPIPNVRIGSAASQRDCRNAAARIWFHPDTATRSGGHYMDISVFTLSEEAQAVVDGVGASLDQLCADVSVKDSDYVVLTGYLTSLIDYSQDLQNPKVLNLDLRNVFLQADVRGEDEWGRLKIAWNPGPVHGELTTPDMKISRPVTKTLGKPPYGVSGGGVWKATPVRPGELWTAQRHIGLLGICSAHLVDTERVEPVTAWRPWLEETVLAM